MSTTGVGPTLAIDGPAPLAPPHSLVNTPGIVVERDQGRWMNGVNIFGYPEDAPSLWAPCSDGTFALKAEGGDMPVARFDPFAVYTPITCSAMGMGSAREFAGRAEVVLEATLSMGIEEGLAKGIPGQIVDINPYFGDGNLIVLGSGAVSPRVGLSWLENAIGETGRQGVVGLTPAVASALQANLLISSRDPIIVTASGNRVVIGDGYIATDPDDEATPSDGEDWIFATGPIEVRIGPLVFNDLAETLERSTNDVTFRAERHVLATWDTALQVGVLVDWTT